MKPFDSHVHYVGDDKERIKALVEKSRYKDIFLGYNALNLETIDFDEHVDACCGAFIMPYCIKETDILMENTRLKKYAESSARRDLFYFPLVSDQFELFEAFPNMLGLKEHFYLHNAFQWMQRSKAYSYLNHHHKMLIIHSDDMNRIDFIKFLTSTYPSMYIQVAHLGCFRRSTTASKLVIDELSPLDNVYFDISTIWDAELITYVYQKCPHKVLFGSDIPYVGKADYFTDYDRIIKEAVAHEEQRNNILYGNAFSLLSEIMR